MRNFVKILYVKIDLFADLIKDEAILRAARKEAIELLANQLTKPVLYKQSIKNIEKEVDMFIEFGGKVLMGINRKVTKVKTGPITDMKTLEKVNSL